MRIVNILYAKTHLARLIEEVIAGVEIIIAKSGKPLVKLIPLDKKRLKKRKLGILAGKLHISDQFDAPLPEEIIRQFEGRYSISAMRCNEERARRQSASYGEWAATKLRIHWKMR